MDQIDYSGLAGIEQDGVTHRVLVVVSGGDEDGRFGWSGSFHDPGGLVDMGAAQIYFDDFTGEVLINRAEIRSDGVHGSFTGNRSLSPFPA